MSNPEQNDALKPHILVISAGFYRDIAKKLEEGAIRELTNAKATYEVVEVAGALEIPVLLSLALKQDRFADKNGRQGFNGVVALGCVIRGETSHYDIVANESSRALIDLAINHQIPLGNGILTVENRDQALARLKLDDNHKGEHAVTACLELISQMDRWREGK